MKHFLSYGQSDQASFRLLDVRASFDYMTVPGTIAAYYAEATAAFVLSSKIPYMIDPRTPLFQDVISYPRASHYSLAERMGPRMRAKMGSDGDPVTFDPLFYDGAVVDELVWSAIGFQRTYGGQAGAIGEKLLRYAKMAAEVSGEPMPREAPTSVLAPAFVLAPYFCSTGFDGWLGVNRAIWDACTRLPDSSGISPVLAATDLRALDALLQSLPDGLSDSTFFWINDFNERTRSREDLEGLVSFVAHHGGKRRLIGLYGGYFSVCLNSSGLFGFGNGLGYSESRGWPDLPSTGAAPPRYYLRQLHAFVAPALAQQVFDLQPELACDCAACLGRRVLGMGYHDLKRHFALVRGREIRFVERSSVEDVRNDLQHWFTSFRETVVGPLRSRGLRLDIGHLERWRLALGQ